MKIPSVWGRRGSADVHGCQVSGAPLHFHRPLRESFFPPAKMGPEVRIEFEDVVRKASAHLGGEKRGSSVLREGE